MFSTPSIPGKTINELLKHWATTAKRNTPAFVSFSADGRKRCLNRREVYQLASAFANKLSNYGVVKGDIVCIALPNSLERIICDMGVLLAGATSMNGQLCRADGQDFLQSLKISKARYVITDPSLKNGAWQFLKDKIDRLSGFVQHNSLPDLHQVLICQRSEPNSNEDFLSQLQSLKASLCSDVSPSDLAAVMTTSGSTGYSKLVKFTHSNLCHFCLQVKAIEPLKEGDRFINCAPLGWAGGYPQWYLGCGVTRYFVDMYNGPPSDMPSFIWHIITSEKIIYGFISPMYTTAILNDSSLWANSNWKPKILCLAGQPVNRGHLEIIGKLCHAVDINYGMTECNLISTHRIQDPTSFENGCAGFPGYGVKVKIVDRHKQEVPRGTMGEILLQSPSLTPGYLNNDTATAAVFTSDGWFSTDDAGYFDPHSGKLHVVGRQSDSILRGVYILYPGWLEEIIRKVDKVKDVVIVPVPDKVLHNEICACIITDIPFNGEVAGSIKLKNINEESVFLAGGSPHTSHTSTSCAEGRCKENGVDEIDRAAVFNSKRRMDLSTTDLLNGSLKSQNPDLEDIRKFGMKKHLSLVYNSTSSKLDFNKMHDQSKIESGLKSADTDHLNEVKPADADDCNADTQADIDCQNHSLLKLEQEIQRHCQKSQLLNVKDAMCMVPQYYVFFNKFALTDTGKTSRKEVRKLAISALTKD